MMTIAMMTIAMFLAHLVGDYILQWDSLALAAGGYLRLATTLPDPWRR